MIVSVGSPGRSRTRLKVKKVTRSSTTASWTNRRPISRAASTLYPPARGGLLPGTPPLSTASRSLLAEGVHREAGVQHQRLAPVGEPRPGLTLDALGDEGPLGVPGRHVVDRLRHGPVEVLVGLLQRLVVD